MSKKHNSKRIDGWVIKEKGKVGMAFWDSFRLYRHTAIYQFLKANNMLRDEFDKRFELVKATLTVGEWLKEAPDA